ncbi:hypothetical protein A9W97_19980 [Mycobacterium gordonae]|nr:hypothetical protein A9W97_19980 [Mycobacterium gordonae]
MLISGRLTVIIDIGHPAVDGLPAPQCRIDHGAQRVQLLKPVDDGLMRQSGHADWHLLRTINGSATAQ